MGRLRELRETRGGLDQALMNFFANFAECAVATHTCLPLAGGTPALMQHLKRSYVISLVTVLETYYRDLLVQAYEADAKLRRTVARKQKQKAPVADVYESVAGGIGLPEWLVSDIRLQSREQIESALEPVFAPTGYFDAVDAYTGLWTIPSASPQPVVAAMPEGWRKDFAELFQRRHQYVHDANCRCEMTGGAMARTEQLVLLLPQMTSVILSERFGKGPLLVSNQGLPTLLTINDVLGEDWEMADDEGAGCHEGQGDLMTRGEER